jgi:cysteine desulfurase
MSKTLETEMKYFDYAATCPLDPEAADVFIKASTEYFANSQSLHDAGSASANLLEGCRREFARLLQVDSAGVYFTSGGSEANFLGIMALLSSVRKKGNHIITGAAEHSSVYNLMKKLEAEGWEVTFLSLNRSGQYELESVLAAVREETVLISLQHGNPEVGSLQPIEEIAKFCTSKQILVHSDCVQTFGKMPLERLARSVDSLSISGHKFYGPKGAGAAFVNPRLAWKPFITGTAHEKGFRPGTVNVPGIAAMTAAAKIAHSKMDSELTRMRELRNSFLCALSISSERIRIFGAEEGSQIPGIVGMSIKGVEGQFVMLECNRRGYAISTGTACNVGMMSPSKTMTAMGTMGKDAKEFFRISFGRGTSHDDVKELGKFLLELSVHVSAV